MNRAKLSRIIRGAFLSLGFMTGVAANAVSNVNHRADLIVYGGTASGVMTAYSAAKEGLQVVLLEPGRHVGGMVSGGLSATDIGKPEVIGGYARDFYMKAAAHYGVHSLDKPEAWRSEPHVAEALFRAMLSEAGVKVELGERLREHHGVRVVHGRIESIVTTDGQRWFAKVYADCSYEGDLMASAGVKYTYGREGVAEYGESLAGVRAKSPTHQFNFPLSAFDKNHVLLPEVSPSPLGTPGTADKLVQAYNFRLILTNDPSDRLPFVRPEHYDRSRFALLANYLKAFQKNMGRAPGIHDVMGVAMIPNHKADFNNRGPFSTDYIGHSAAYPEASYAEKRHIWEEHLEYTKELVYFLWTDTEVPASLREELNVWGLPKDEFLDTDHWPNQLYIREARRMVGVYVMRQADLQTDREKPDSIGMGSYNSDSHHVQRIALSNGDVMNEGCMEVPVQPYEIPYRVMLPKREQSRNLLVPVSVSASHVAYSSLRMEPQYMIMGQAAGVAASLSVRHHVDVRDVPVGELQKILRHQNAILHLSEANGTIR
jgi:hypothetical protein